jgi:hypothetical protein
MKKLLNVKFVLLIAMLLSTSSCNITDPFDELISECDAKENQITPTDIIFQGMRVNVTWKDKTAAEHLTVKIQIHKEYCEGKTAGHFEEYAPDGVTNELGWWFSRMKFTYTYKNKKDKVLLRYIVAERPDWVFDYVYRWEDVDGAYVNNRVDDIQLLRLPINEDGS